MKKAIFILVPCIFSYVHCAFSQGSVSATYTAGDIPTSFNAFDASCNGNNIILQLTMPAGDAYPVTGIDISYSMTALGSGQMDHQRSQIKCVNNNTKEATVYSGVGAAAGTYNYNRTGVTIANGTYAGGTVLSFELHAWRTVEVSPGCHTAVNMVNAGSWTITVFYGAVQTVGKTGINNTNPVTVLDVNGKLKLSDDLTAPQAGMVRWNSSANDFEGYNGSVWVSFTNKGSDHGEWGNTSVTENQARTASDGTGDDVFGYSVCISGNYAIVGAYRKSVGTNILQGKAYIFFRPNTAWVQQAMLTASDGAVDDFFGHSVSISGDYAIVGAYGKTVGANSGQGKAYIFNRSGTSWAQQAMLTASDGAATDFFGWSVSISGDYAIAGGHNNKVGANAQQGKAYIFIRSGATWLQQAMLIASDGADHDHFGFNVSISGDYAIVGVPEKDIGANVNQGKAYVFNRSGATWLQQAILTASDGAFDDNFGWSV
ncbi:MAG TPA: FG-GAP repeat protein, partial [Gammaproteobacteria bacterium]|nr:FG-GAP repeat protein [Gammaproteobacteria bacterium]